MLLSYGNLPPKLLLSKIGLPYKIQNCLGKNEVRKIKNQTGTEQKQNTTIYMCNIQRMN